MYNHKQPNNTTATGNSPLQAAGVGLEGWYGVAPAPLNICDYPVLLLDTDAITKSMLVNGSECYVHLHALKIGLLPET